LGATPRAAVAAAISPALAATALDILATGKDYYLFPVYPTTFAVGAVTLTNLRPWLVRVWLLGALAVSIAMTQLFSEEFGWHELEKQVAAVYQSLPPEERRHAAIFGANYGEAAAVDVYGQADGLPPALSGEDQYFLWGTHGYDGSVIIHINGDPARWRRLCQSVTVAGNFGVEYAMPFEKDRAIFICRGLRLPFVSLWPRLQRYL
jgi:hypothetical protein